MDIIVTVSKSETGNVAKEDAFATRHRGHIVQFWRIGRKPKKLNTGDRVYFIESGQILYYHKFLGYVYDPVCEVTGRTWQGLNLLLAWPPQMLVQPIPRPGFRGFAYIERL